MLQMFEETTKHLTKASKVIRIDEIFLHYSCHATEIYNKSKHIISRNQMKLLAGIFPLTYF